jgi:site-specific DNA-methyltransferase (adenine-specific)
MSVLRGDCVEVMAGMEPDSVDAIVCDPPYGMGFMGKEWDRLDGAGFHAPKDEGRTFTNDSGHMFDNLKALPQYGPARSMQAFHHAWAAAAYRVAKPGAYLLAFGGTRTVHRMTCALEDAGWVIRDMLVWAYAQGFPKSRASLKPAWEPIVMARKPGASRDLNIDAARIPSNGETIPRVTGSGIVVGGKTNGGYDRPWNHDADAVARRQERADAAIEAANTLGRWPANVILTDPIFDGGWDGVVGGGESAGMGRVDTLRRGHTTGAGMGYGSSSPAEARDTGYDDQGGYSRYFMVPKAPTRERKLSDGRRSPHPTQKPEALIRHLVTLVTPPGGVVLDPFLGSGTLGVVCDGLGMKWLGIEREDEYADWSEDRIADGKAKWEVTA